MSTQYISLQGEFYLSKITNGVAGAMRHLGNVPEFELEIGAEVLEHVESMTGKRTTDFTMVQTTSVNFSGQLEKADKENLKYIVSGETTEVTTKTVTDVSLGTVVAGQEIKLDGYFSKVVYTQKAHDLFWDKLYEPVIRFIMVVSDKIGIFQNGRTNLYAGYILMYLCLVLIFGYYYL